MKPWWLVEMARWRQVWVAAVFVDEVAWKQGALEELYETHSERLKEEEVRCFVT